MHASHCALRGASPPITASSCRGQLFPPPRCLCRCVINFLENTTISGLYFPEKKGRKKKKPQTFHSKKIYPWLTSSFVEKNEHTFSFAWLLGAPFPSIFFWGGRSKGGGAGSCLLFIDRLPRVGHGSIACLGAPCGLGDTCVRRSRSHRQQPRWSCSPA